MTEKEYNRRLGKVAAKRAIGRAAAKGGTKVIARFAGKQAAKRAVRAAGSPWLIGADLAEMGSHEVARHLGASKSTAKGVSKCIGLVTSVATGAVVAGPAGAVAGGIIHVAVEGLDAIGATDFAADAFESFVSLFD